MSAWVDIQRGAYFRDKNKIKKNMGLYPEFFGISLVFVAYPFYKFAPTLEFESLPSKNSGCAPVSLFQWKFL